MTLLVMMVQLVLAMRPQLMMMLTVFGDGYRRHGGIVLAVDVRSIFRWAPAVVEERTCPTSEQIRTTVTVHIAKLPAVHFWQTVEVLDKLCTGHPNVPQSFSDVTLAHTHPTHCITYKHNIICMYCSVT